jgi:hypothetical protein
MEVLVASGKGYFGSFEKKYKIPTKNQLYPKLNGRWVNNVTNRIK